MVFDGVNKVQCTFKCQILNPLCGSQAQVYALVLRFPSTLAMSCCPFSLNVLKFD